MQVLPEQDIAAHFDGLIAEQLPGRRGVAAWRALLQAHATLIRQLDTDLIRQTGLDLGHFDVLAQLAWAGGALRMTELAARAFTSRSGLTRRVAQLVDQGLMSRATDETDARAVVVALTDAGVGRLSETVPVHLGGVADLFVAKLDDQELALLETALAKVTIDCNFG
jgi:DNA-binding MarR family transcriptional regulator